MTEEEKKIHEKIDRRVNEVAGEKGHLSFDEFAGLAKELLGDSPQNDEELLQNTPIDNNDDIMDFDDLQEIENPADTWDINPFYPLPEWAECPDASLEVGCDYVYFAAPLIYMRCRVLFNDGMSAILKVTQRYFECFKDILYYEEVKRYFPDFEDPEATERSEYICLDVESEHSYFCRYENDDEILCYMEDEDFEDFEMQAYSVDPADFRAWRESNINSK